MILKKILNVIEDRFTKIEDALIDLKMQQPSSKNENILDNVQTSERDLVIDILKNKISDLEIELKRKNVVIDYLHYKISSKATDNSLSSSATRNSNSTSTQDSVGNKITEFSYLNAAIISKHKNPTIRPSNQQSNNSHTKRKILVAGDSLLNNIHETGHSKQHTVKVKNFPGATTEPILEKMENLQESKPDVLILHAGTDDLPKNINPLNNLRKLHRKCLELSPETKHVFSNIIIRKDKPNLDKHRKDVNTRMKNFCKQKDIGLINSCNLEEHHLGTKKLHLNNKGNSAFAKNILHFIES